MNETLVSDIRPAPAPGEVRPLADAELDAVAGGWVWMAGFVVGFAAGVGVGYAIGRAID